MNQITETSLQNRFTGLSRLKLFFALSRTPHGLLDMCTPGFGALLWLGEFPSLFVFVIGMLTTFAGYTAVYALNDVVDYKVDREKAADGGLASADGDLDGILVRHPMAQGYLSLKEGVFWSVAWSLLAFVGAMILNPICVLIFIGGCALETIYCLLWRVSPYRTFVSGAVKTSGAIAAVYAVDPNPSGDFLVLLFLLLFFWEIGGQNIPNDWADHEEDSRMHAKTIPIRWGLPIANRLIQTTIILTLAMSMVVFSFARVDYGLFYIFLALAAGGYLLLLPALRLNKSRARADAMALFNLASYYPLALLGMVLIRISY
jgi:4-hydroxybenzoate polyprenyltransferase